MDKMEATRRKWCDDLEAMLECPYCFERLGETTNMCEAGHNICKNCFVQVSNCGICKKPFTSTRNYLAENLGSILDNIKISMMNPTDIMNKVWNFEKNSVGTQTDFDPTFSNDDSSVSGDLRAALPTDIPWGVYPCLLQPNCKTRCNFFDIIKHFKAQHPLEYKEHLDENLPHSNTWEFTYDTNKFYDRAFLISKVGLFLLHVGIDDNGNFRSYLIMYGSGREARRFAYNFEVESGKEKTFFFGIVNSTRLAQMAIDKEGFFISCTEPIFSEFITNKIFKISVNIEERDVTYSDLRVEIAEKSVQNKRLNNNNLAAGSSQGARRRPPRLHQRSSNHSSSTSLDENYSPRHDGSNSSRRRDNANNKSFPHSGEQERPVDLKKENENSIGGNLFASLVTALTKELKNSVDNN